MVKFKKTNNYKFWHSPLVLIVLFAMVVFFSYNIADLAKKSRETRDKKNLVLQEIKYLQDKTESLNEGISLLDTDLGKEEELRGKFPMTKQGEKVVVILNQDPSQDGGVATVEKSTKWNRFLEIFKIE